MLLVPAEGAKAMEGAMLNDRKDKEVARLHRVGEGIPARAGSACRGDGDLVPTRLERGRRAI